MISVHQADEFLLRNRCLGKFKSIPPPPKWKEKGKMDLQMDSPKLLALREPPSALNFFQAYTSVQEI